MEIILQSGSNKKVDKRGFKSLKNVSQFYSKIDIYICTSDLEGFCLPVFEALLYGCIIVTTYQPAVIEYIPSEFINNGFFMNGKLETEDELSLRLNLLNEIKKAINFSNDLNEYKSFIKKTLKWNKEKFLLYRELKKINIK